MAVTNARVVVAAAAPASLETSLSGADNDLVFTAKDVGEAGNGISIEYVDPAANNADLSVDVDGDAITVNLATDGVGVITTIASEISAEVAATVAADALVGVADAAANDGSGVVTAMPAAFLVGGFDSATPLVGADGDGAGSAFIRNAGSASVFVGGDGVTAATGYELEVGESIVLPVTPGDSLHGIAASGSQIIHVFGN